MKKIFTLFVIMITLASCQKEVIVSPIIKDGGIATPPNFNIHVQSFRESYWKVDSQYIAAALVWQKDSIWIELIPQGRRQ